MPIFGTQLIRAGIWGTTNLREKSAPQRGPSTENNVFLSPGMNAAAMGARKFLRFYGRGLPELFFYGSSGIQIGRAHV